MADDRIEFTATGRYFKVYCNGEYVSQHTAEREASQKAANILLADGSATVSYVHEYSVKATCTWTGAHNEVVTPPPGEVALGRARVITPEAGKLVTESRLVIVARALATPIPGDVAPTIISTPAPVFTVGTAAEYEMVQHVVDDGRSPVSYVMTGTRSPTLFLDVDTGKLIYNGGDDATTSTSHVLLVHDPAGLSTSAAFTIEFQTPPTETITLNTIPNISFDVGGSHLLTTYINDPGGLRTSTAVTGLAGFATYNEETETLTGAIAGTETGLELVVCWDEVAPTFLLDLPLLTASQFEYIGSFDVPQSDSSSYGPENGGIAYNAANNSLFIAGYDTIGDDPIAEISIPELRTSNFLTADILQSWVDGCGGKQSQVIGNGNGNQICGMTVHNGRLIIHVATYYNDTVVQAESTFARSTNLGLSTVAGPCKIGTLNQRYIAGGGMTLPDNWRTEFGGYASVCGGGGGLSRVQTLSNGPTFIFYDPDQVLGTNDVTATPATYYPSSEDIGSFNGPFESEFTGMSTHRNTFVVDGYRTMVGFGRHGDSNYFNVDQTLPDGSTATSNGQWAETQVVNRFWLYDASDVKDAFDGTVANNVPTAYEHADFTVGNSAPQDEYQSNRGGTFDPDNNIFYIAERNGAGSPYPRIHAIRINV